MSGRWGGRKSQAYRAAVFAEYGTTCWLRLPGCTYRATTVDHVKPRSERPDLEWSVANGRPACVHCNSSKGRRPHVAAVTVDNRRFFEKRPARKPRLLPFFPGPPNNDGPAPGTGPATSDWVLR